MATIDVDISGPLFDGRARAELAAAEDDILDDVAQQAYANVMAFLDASIRNPTPYYETQIVVDSSIAQRTVHDRGVIYGPWLEGTGSRNKTTRFKGYSSFRRAAQKTEAEAGPIADNALRPHLARMQ
ncbi:MAG TPA: hypothetical protein VE465_02090 [Streptosporangiaceae bacterium]|jgi:hypothetical protein|nr:hypothetical protein [Streptosporangiaceae bacterium]